MTKTKPKRCKKQKARKRKREALKRKIIGKLIFLYNLHTLSWCVYFGYGPMMQHIRDCPE